VKHALGSRLIELPDRTIDNPITVGRAAGVEVQVPSVSVAARHCVLFRYEGRWAVQDVQAANGEGTSGTFVNGQQVMDPVMLQIGDVISVGTEVSAPTIEVDPAAAAEGRTGWAGDEMTVAPMVPGYAAPAAYNVPGSYAAAPGYVSTTGGGGYNRAAPGRPPAAPAPGAWDDHGDHHDNGDHIDLSTAASTASYTPSYRRKKKQQLSPAAIVIGAVASIAIVSVAIWYFVTHQQPTQVVVVQPKPKPVDDGNHSNNIFGIGSATPDRSNEVTPPRPANTHQQPAATPDNTSSTPTPETPTPTPAAPVKGPQQVASAGTKSPGSEEMTPASPGKTTPATPAAPTDEWAQMQDLHSSPADPALAIFRFSDYQKHHPTDHADDIQKYVEDKFDRLWWDRIEQLFKKGDRLVKDAKTVQDQIFDETDKDMKKKEQDDLAKLKAQQKATKETITDKMGYKEDGPPPASATELAKLREKRDNAKYTAWKKTTLSSIVNNKGTTDWAADN
jgi:vacuolar-type H+-ATPase subunit H